MEVGEEEAERDNTEDVYDDRHDVLEKEELAGKDNKALTEALLVPVMMIFLRTGSTVEICVILGIVCFIVAIILRLVMFSILAAISSSRSVYFTQESLPK